MGSSVFQVENKEPITSDLIFADEDFFKLFTYKFIEGNVETALKEPMTIVITKSMSNKLFGNIEAMGKTIKLNNSKSLAVSAVIEEPDANSCLNLQCGYIYRHQKNRAGNRRGVYRLGMV